MDILITHGARMRSLHLHPLQIFAFVFSLLLLLLGLSGAIYHFVFLKAAREGWPIVSNITGLMVRDEVAQRDRFMRENLDAMARKVGEMQAKLVHLDAIGSRVSGLAGIKPEELRAIDAPAPAASGAAGKNSALPVPVGGSGGPYIPVDSPSMERINEMVAEMESQAEHSSDVFMLVESRLLERKLASLVMPSIAPVDGPIGSGFGFRSDPFTGRAALHTGLDFPTHIGTPINSAAGGIVRSVETDPAYGLMLEIDHGNGLVTRYAHTSKILVRSGELVRRGQSVALVGSTGRSTGPHLHFEVLLDGVPQNPQRFLSARSENLAAAPMDPRSGPRDKGRRVKAR
jgi:murein DD-endopeptidase MepM/ murein hydrolase activator NlpD